MASKTVKVVSDITLPNGTLIGYMVQVVGPWTTTQIQCSNCDWLRDSHPLTSARRVILCHRRGRACRSGGYFKKLTPKDKAILKEAIGLGWPTLVRNDILRHLRRKDEAK